MSTEKPEDDDIPMARALTHNEEEMVGGTILTMASTNVEEIWFGCPFCEIKAPEETLYVRFKSGGVYAYYGVPLDVVMKFIETPSPGRFVWNELRDLYPYAKIGTAPKQPKPNIVRKIWN